MSSKDHILCYDLEWNSDNLPYNNIKAIDLPIKIEAYIQTCILKKPLERISFEKRRGFGAEEEIEEVIKRLETIDAKGE